MTEYAWGVLTPFLAVAGAALAVGAAWLLIALARHLWAKTHYALMDTVKLAPNRARFLLKGDPEDDRPEFIESANKFRDALLESPKMRTFAGIGWRVLLVREVRTDKSAQEDVADPDEVLS